MKLFYETYAGNEKMSALLTQLSWTNHLLIMSKSKTKEERGKGEGVATEREGGDEEKREGEGGGERA